MENTLDKNSNIEISELTPVQQKKVDSISKELDINDSQSIIQFGVGAQTEISNFADDILEQVQAKDTGEVGETLTTLMLRVKDLKINELSTSKGFFSKIPILSGLVDSVKKFTAQYEKISFQIDTIVDNLTKSRMELIKDITLLDKMYEKNGEYIQNLDFYILAGKIKLEEIHLNLIPKLKLNAEKSNDPVDAQKVQDISQMANRFEKKIHDLTLSRMISIQTAPQVRLIQNNNQLLVEKIQSSILNTIPLWKNQIVISISLFRQKKALELQKEVSETTNDILSKNADLLKTNSLEIAKESEKGIVEIETLQKVHNSLIETIEETLVIQQEGKNKRAEAEQILNSLEKELKEKLIGAK